MSSPLHKRKPPIENFLAMVLVAGSTLRHDYVISGGWSAASVQTSSMHCLVQMNKLTRGQGGELLEKGRKTKLLILGTFAHNFWFIFHNMRHASMLIKCGSGVVHKLFNKTTQKLGA